MVNTTKAVRKMCPQLLSLPRRVTLKASLTSVENVLLFCSEKVSFSVFWEKTEELKEKWNRNDWMTVLCVLTLKRGLAFSVLATWCPHCHYEHGHPLGGVRSSWQNLFLLQITILRFLSTTACPQASLPGWLCPPAAFWRDLHYPVFVLPPSASCTEQSLYSMPCLLL